MADILETLKQEHHEVKELFSKIVEQDKREQSILDAITKALKPHLEGEEELVYQQYSIVNIKILGMRRLKSTIWPRLASLI